MIYHWRPLLLKTGHACTTAQQRLIKQLDNSYTPAFNEAEVASTQDFCSSQTSSSEDQLREELSQVSSHPGFCWRLQRRAVAVRTGRHLPEHNTSLTMSHLINDIQALGSTANLLRGKSPLHKAQAEIIGTVAPGQNTSFKHVSPCA